MIQYVQGGSPGGYAPSMQPASAQGGIPEGQVLVPASWLGDIMQVVAPIAGAAAGAYVGQPALGQQIGGAAGQALGTLSADPQFMDQGGIPEGHVLVPASWFSGLTSVLKQVGQVAAPVVGTAIGARFGQPALGQKIGTYAGHALGTLSADPQFMDQGGIPEGHVLVPASWFSGITSALKQVAQTAAPVLKQVGQVAAPVAGTIVGGYFGQPMLGRQIGSMAGHALSTLSADPQFMDQGGIPEGHVLVPASWFSGLTNVLKQVGQVAAPVIGTAVGARFGQPALGQKIGGYAGQALGTLSADPQFSAQPQYPWTMAA